MSTMTKARRAEQEEARQRLLADITPGTTLYTSIRAAARSGMSRCIQAYQIVHNEPRWLSYNIAKAGVGYWCERHEAVKMGGCGMDMGFALVYKLSHILFPSGFECIGQGCPSNDHTNGDRNYEKRWHASGGYALKQRWL